MNQVETTPRSYENMEKTEKILALQEELLNVRKEMSKKQSQWDKQRSSLLSKNEVANIEVAQLKQRLTNLSKINETLALAVTNQQNMSTASPSDLKLKKPKQLSLGEISDMNSEDDLKKSGKYQEELKKMSRMIAEKDFQISNLTKMGNQLRAKIQERNNLYSNLEETCFNLKRKLEKKEEEILKLYKQTQELQEKLELNDQYIDETRRKSFIGQPQLSKRNIQQNDLQETEQSKKYSKNSSYLMIKPTPDYSCYDPQSDCIYFHNSVQASAWNVLNESEGLDGSDDEEDRLLCEICDRVYSIGEFEEHAYRCRQRAQEASNQMLLLNKKREIESQLERIKKEEEKQNNLRGRYFDVDTTSRDKILEIREIAKGLASNKGKKSPYNDFSIKTNFYY